MTGLPSQALRYYAPSPALRPYLTNLFAWTGEQAAFEAWMPAIESQVCIRLDGYGAIRFQGTSVTLVDRPILVGPMGGTLHMRTTADMTAVGAGLTARGYLRLIGVPAGQLVDSVVDLAAMLGASLVSTLVEALAKERSYDMRARRLERWLWSRLLAPSRADLRAAAIDDWLGAREPVTLAALHDRLGVSVRQAERIARDLLGLGPKSLAMRHRALQAAQRIAAQGASRSVIDAAGYADQSHMIRDFARFIGVTPVRLARVEIQRHVFEDPERAGATLAHGPRESDL